MAAREKTETEFDCRISQGEDSNWL
jgi:hypothetical protein